MHDSAQDLLLEMSSDTPVLVVISNGIEPPRLPPGELLHTEATIPEDFFKSLKQATDLITKSLVKPAFCLVALPISMLHPIAIGRLMHSLIGFLKHRYSVHLKVITYTQRSSLCRVLLLILAPTAIDHRWLGKGATALSVPEFLSAPDDDAGSPVTRLARNKGFASPSLEIFKERDRPLVDTASPPLIMQIAGEMIHRAVIRISSSKKRRRSCSPLQLDTGSKIFKRSIENE
jgi:hypothetical protein